MESANIKRLLDMNLNNKRDETNNTKTSELEGFDKYKLIINEMFFVG